METGRRRRGRPKYTVLDISSRVDDANVDNGYLWEADEEERGRKRDKEAEYHLFVKTHQKRRHRGTRHRARSSS